MSVERQEPLGYATKKVETAEEEEVEALVKYGEPGEGIVGVVGVVEAYGIDKDSREAYEELAEEYGESNVGNIGLNTTIPFERNMKGKGPLVAANPDRLDEVVELLEE